MKQRTLGINFPDMGLTGAGMSSMEKVLPQQVILTSGLYCNQFTQKTTALAVVFWPDFRALKYHLYFNKLKHRMLMVLKTTKAVKVSDPRGCFFSCF